MNSNSYLLLTAVALLAVASSVLADCRYGPGFYCGSGIAQNANYLYECRNGSYYEYAECGEGCHEADPGFPDYCLPTTSTSATSTSVAATSVSPFLFVSDSTPILTSTSTSTSTSISTSTSTSTGNSSQPTAEYTELADGSKVSLHISATFTNVSNTDKSCPFGEGDYCGEAIGKDPEQLWTCTGFDGRSVEWKLKETCTNGCKVTPASHDDSCYVSANATCPHGDGLYCGGPLNTTAGNLLSDTTLHHLYQCLGGAMSDLGLCPNGCEITPIGKDDFCKTISHQSQGFQVNSYVLQKIKIHEGFVANFTSDGKTPPTWSIGYGHVCRPTISESDCANIHPPILENEATAILSDDVKAATDCVCKYTKTDRLNDNQYGALVDFILSDSCDTYRLSRVRTAVNYGDLTSVPEALLSYDTDSLGLQNRHRDQGDMWIAPGTGNVTAC